MRINLQPTEKQIYREDGALEVFKVWYTIQGEGPYAGTPAVFVRLAGCDLQCPGCDTDYTSNRELIEPKDLVNRVMDLLADHIAVTNFCTYNGLVVLTGGEPFRQNIIPFIRHFYERYNDICIQIETNGTLFTPVGEEDSPLRKTRIVCSPKTPKIHPDFYTDFPHIGAYKYVLRVGEIDEDGLPMTALGGPRPARPHRGFAGPIYVQPMDEDDPTKNSRNLHAALKSAMTFGYILGTQFHKELGLE